MLFTFLYKFAAVEDGGAPDATKRLEMARDSFSTVLPLLEATASDKVSRQTLCCVLNMQNRRVLNQLHLQVAMSGLKVVGALVGRVPQAIAALPPSELQRLGRYFGSVKGVIHSFIRLTSASTCLLRVAALRRCVTVGSPAPSANCPPRFSLLSSPLRSSE